MRIRREQVVAKQLGCSRAEGPPFLPSRSFNPSAPFPHALSKLLDMRKLLVSSPFLCLIACNLFAQITPLGSSSSVTQGVVGNLPESASVVWRDANNAIWESTNYVAG